MTLSTTEQQTGSSKALHSMGGRRMHPCCGFVEIVCFSCLVILSRLLMVYLLFQRGLAKVSFGTYCTTIPVIGNLYCCQVRPLSRKSSIFENRDQLWSRITSFFKQKTAYEMSGAC